MADSQPLNLSPFSTDLFIDMTNNRLLFGNFGVAIFFTLLFIAAGVLIGVDLKQQRANQPDQTKTEEESEAEQANQASLGENNQLTGKVSQLQDSIKVLLAKQAEPQVQTEPEQTSSIPDPGPPPPGDLMVQPTLIIAGASKSVLKDKVLISVSLNSFNDSTEAEVTIRKIRNPLEKAMEYGEVLRLFYASTGRKESFQYAGSTYHIHILRVGKFGTQMGVKFSLYRE